MSRLRSTRRPKSFSQTMRRLLVVQRRVRASNRSSPGAQTFDFRVRGAMTKGLIPRISGAPGKFRAHLSTASTRRFHQMSFPGEFMLVRPDGELNPCLRVDTAQRSNRRAEFRQRTTAPQSVASLLLTGHRQLAKVRRASITAGRSLKSTERAPVLISTNAPVNLHPPLPVFFLTGHVL